VMRLELAGVFRHRQREGRLRRTRLPGYAGI
jgi:hypothetical protein